jgi:peptide/nickel transport system substrate-binding protein
MISVLVVASMVLGACQPQTAPTPETVVQTVEVVRTVMVEGTPQTVIETVVVTVEPPAEPEPAETGEPVRDIQPEFKNPDTYTAVTIGDPETLDPAWTYETSGSAVQQNIYEGLVWFDREKYDEFIPALATEWTTSEDGLTWTFNVREGVTFHQGGTLEPHDVAYTLQRNLLQGRTDGPQWIAYEGFFGSEFATASSKDFAAAVAGAESFDALSAAQLTDVCEQVKAKIVADDEAGTVTFSLAQPMPWLLAVAAQNFMGAILDMEWMVENGDWDGECATWQDYADPAAEDTILFDQANGTGPYVLDHWTPGEEIVLTAFDGYWRTEPIWEGGPSGPAQIKNVVIQIVDEWGTRLAMLEAGDADTIYAPPAFRGQLYPYASQTCDAAGNCEETNPNGYLTIYRDLPQPAMTPAQFNWQINVEGGNPYVGSGAMDANGIPPDFFQDIHVRKAFSYCFDFEAMINDALAGEGKQAQGPILEGMMGYREGEAPLYSYDPAKCEEEFMLADVDKDGIPAGEDEEGDVWNTGFYMQIAYNQGNETRRLASEILKAGIEGVNPGFSVQVLALPWPVLLGARTDGKLPIYVGGWLEDFHDPHNWVQPFLYSAGAYGRVINMTEEYAAKYDDLIIRGAQASDPAEREAIYQDIQLQAQEDAPVIWMYQQADMHPFQEWIKGWYFNPAYSQPEYSWIYALSKEAP